MLIFGLILLLVGWLVGVAVLFWIGLVLAVVGGVLMITGRGVY